jgi:hypothetical protein
MSQAVRISRHPNRAGRRRRAWRIVPRFPFRESAEAVVAHNCSVTKTRHAERDWVQCHICTYSTAKDTAYLSSMGVRRFFHESRASILWLITSM